MSKNRTVSLVPTVTLTYNKDDLGFDFLNRKICLKTNSQRIVIHITLAEYLELQKWYQKKNDSTMDHRLQILEQKLKVLSTLANTYFFFSRNNISHECVHAQSLNRV